MKTKKKSTEIFKQKSISEIFKNPDTCMPHNGPEFYKFLKIPKKEWPKVYFGMFPTGKVGFSLDWTKKNCGFGSFDLEAMSKPSHNNARDEICASCHSVVKSHWKYCQECGSYLNRMGGRKLSPVA